MGGMELTWNLTLRNPGITNELGNLLTKRCKRCVRGLRGQENVFPISRSLKVVGSRVSSEGPGRV